MSHLTTYKLKLKLLSPVFIGQGSELNKKEYLFFPNKQKVVMLNMAKFVDFLDSRDLINDYSNFMLGNQYDLRIWLENTIRGKIPYDCFTSYELYAGDALDERRSLKGIQLFIKDKQGNPYIPGSSLKGAIRTAILSRMLSEKREFALQSINALNNNPPRDKGKYAYCAETADIETQLLNTLNLNERRRSDAVNSVMKGIQISDSAPLSTSSLVLCGKIDVLKSGEMKKIYVCCRECLKPGTEVEFDVTFDNIIAQQSGITKEYVYDSIIHCAQIQNRQYSKFQKPLSFISESAPDGCELYIGGGAGFVSKTFVYAMDEAKALKFVASRMQEFFYKHYHRQDESIGVSPHTMKCTMYNKKIYQMGKCRVIF